MSVLRISAPGKTILHGEHAVVYGKAAIAISVNLRTQATVHLKEDGKINLSLRNLDLHMTWNAEKISNIPVIISDSLPDLSPSQDLLNSIAEEISLPSDYSEVKKQAAVTFIYLYINIMKRSNGVLQAIHIDISSQLPMSAGLGSSASYAVCLSAAFLTASGKVKSPFTKKDLSLISNWAFQAEMIFHGRPSGIDNSICTYGGALLFRSGSIAETLPQLPPLNILLVNTKVPRNTKVLVSDVKIKRDKFPDVLDPVISAIDSISLHCWKLLQHASGNHVSLQHTDALQELITMNQHLLNCIGAGHPQLDIICQVAAQYQLSAKLTGAGGGGCALIILPSDADIAKKQANLLKEKFKKLGFECWEAVLGIPGVTIELSEL